ncbi:MAG: MlaD family protein [Prevotellaceae bacterium]|jgi:phospholipid/cholesterol/gamma-HCH transport system substrate-binding protein|nr:MlaD family protein [Prevotellaceae bacterium]
MQIKKEFKIGLLVVVSIALLFFGVNYLKGINIFSPTNSYKAEFEQISGLATAAPVTAKGYKIGQVHGISYDFSRQPSFTVEIIVEDGIKLPVGTQAVLYDSDVMGTKAIEIKFPETRTGAFYKPGDTVQGTIAKGMMDKVSDEVLPSISSSTLQLDSLLRAIRVLAENAALQNSLGSLEQTMKNLENSTGDLNKIINSQVPVMLTGLQTTTANFEQISSSLKKIDFEKTVRSLNGTAENLQTLTGKLSSGEGTLGLLLNDSTLYNNMNNTMNSADKLLIDFKQNPKRYVHFSVFGKSDK